MHFRRHDIVFHYPKLICPRHYVQLLFRCVVWPGCAKQITNDQKEHYSHTDGKIKLKLGWHNAGY